MAKKKLRFVKTKEKHTQKVYWVASACENQMPTKDLWYLIYPRGAGFDLFEKSGWTRGKEKIGHVSKFESAKTIANLLVNG